MKPRDLSNKKKALIFGLPLAGALALPTIALAEEDQQAVFEAASPIETVDTDLAAMTAFWDAGYTYEHALALVEAWNVDVLEAKITAGGMILAGDTTAFDSIVDGAEFVEFVADQEWPEGVDPIPAGDTTAMSAFWNAGYSYGQLLALVEAWELDEFEAKIKAGGMILAGDTSAFDGIVEGVEDVEYVETD